MPVNAPSVYRICGLRPNGSVVPLSLIRGGNQTYNMRRLAGEHGCVVTCLVNARTASNWDAIKTIAIEKLRRMHELMKIQTPAFH